MKRLIFIFLICFLGKISQSQTLYPTPYQGLGSVGVAVNNNGGMFVRGTFVPPIYADTSIANSANYVKNYSGSLIITSSDNKIWQRNSTATKWIAIGNTIPQGLQSVLDYDNRLTRNDSVRVGNNAFTFDSVTNFKANILGSLNMGYNSTASGSNATAFGVLNTASGSRSTAMGISTTASGLASFAVGANTGASNNYAIALGHGAISSGMASYAMAEYSEAQGNNSVVLGSKDTITAGIASMLLGSGLTNSTDSTIKIGFRNNSHNHSIGIGVTNNLIYNNPSKVLSLDANGNLISVTSGSGGSTTLPQAYDNGNRFTTDAVQNMAGNNYTIDSARIVNINSDSIFLAGDYNETKEGNYLSNRPYGFDLHGHQTIFLQPITGQSYFYSREDGYTHIDANPNLDGSLLGTTFSIDPTGSIELKSENTANNNYLSRFTIDSQKDTAKVSILNSDLFIDKYPDTLTTNFSQLGRDITTGQIGVIAGGGGGASTLQDVITNGSTYVGDSVFSLKSNSSVGEGLRYDIVNANFSVGNNNTVGNILSVAMGDGNTATGQTSTAIGESNYAEYRNTVAIGRDNYASDTSSIAIGNENNSNHNYSITLGNNLSSNNDYDIVLGNRENKNITINNTNNLYNNNAEDSVLTTDIDGNLKMKLVSSGSGTVTSVATGYGLSGGPITTTGTLLVDSTTLSGKYVRRADSVANGYYPYSSNPRQYIESGTTGSLKSLTITGTAGDGHIHLRHQSVDPTGTGQSTTIFANSNGDLKYKNASSYYTTLETYTNTADRNYKFQNKSYTVADSADLAAKLNITDTANMRVRLFAGTNISSISGTYPNLTINASASSGWLLAGNSITAGTDFLGTTNNTSLRIKTNNIKIATFDSLGVVTIDSSMLVNGITIGKGKSKVASNTAVGVNSLLANTTGSLNTAIGFETLKANITGTSNTALGYAALTASTTVSNNTAIGYNALSSLTNGGTSNTAVGGFSLYSNNSGSNTAVGYASLLSNTGSGNVAIGLGAGQSLGAVSNIFVLNNVNQGSAANDSANALMWGRFNATASQRYITTSGSMNIGSVAIPTARLQLPSGSTSASTAPLKLTSGTNLTVAEAGAIEYNGTNLFFTPSSATRNNFLITASVNTVTPTLPNRTITVVIDGVTLYISAKTTND
jgi:hypothetical protein